jgi:hypothetical protein
MFVLVARHNDNKREQETLPPGPADEDVAAFERTIRIYGERAARIGHIEALLPAETDPHHKAAA